MSTLPCMKPKTLLILRRIGLLPVTFEGTKKRRGQSRQAPPLSNSGQRIRVSGMGSLAPSLPSRWCGPICVRMGRDRRQYLSQWITSSKDRFSLVGHSAGTPTGMMVSSRRSWGMPNSSLNASSRGRVYPSSQQAP